VIQEVKPAFVGSQQEIELAQRVFDLMLLQGRSFGGDAPIRLSLRQLSSYFVEQGLYTQIEEADSLLDEALKRNSRVFYREERDGAVYYTTSKKGSYTPPVRIRSGHLPTITDRHIAAPMAPSAAPLRTAARKPDFIKRDQVGGTDLAQLLKTAHATPIFKEPIPVAVKEQRQPKAAPPPPPPPVKRVPQIETAQGVMINLSKSPADILAKHRDFFNNLVRDRLATDERFVSFGDKWMLAEQLTTLAKGELRQVREFIEASGGPEADESLVANVFNKAPDQQPAFLFSLNYQLMAEKKVFEFLGSANQNLWWIAGASSPHVLRAPLKPAEIGQDLKYLEDEPPVTKLAGNRWLHTLTFYEWENGILPYSPEAKVLFPAPLFKEQKTAQLRFEAPQFEISAFVELHYPTGNRGGWIEGLSEILAVFVSGAKLVIEHVHGKPDTFSITFESNPVQERTVLLFDTKRQRFVFQPLPLNYQVDESFLLERQRFGGMKDVRRLEEANRRKGDAVIIFAFEKVGAKSTREEKTIYRARLEDLLPVINIEKLFSKTSLLRFFTTHPHYQKDETEEGYWLYIPD
jgi:hypothetical protein